MTWRHAEANPWSPVSSRIRSFSKLQPGWNGYGSEPIHSAVTALSVLMADELKQLGYLPKNVGPTGDGSVVIAASRPGQESEVEIVNSGSFGVAKIRAMGNECFDAESLDALFGLFQESR